MKQDLEETPASQALEEVACLPSNTYTSACAAELGWACTACNVNTSVTLSIPCYLFALSAGQAN